MAEMSVLHVSNLILMKIVLPKIDVVQVRDVQSLLLKVHPEMDGHAVNIWKHELNLISL